MILHRPIPFCRRVTAHGSVDVDPDFLASHQVAHHLRTCVQEIVSVPVADHSVGVPRRLALGITGDRSFEDAFHLVAAVNDAGFGVNEQVLSHGWFSD